MTAEKTTTEKKTTEKKKIGDKAKTQEVSQETKPAGATATGPTAAEKEQAAKLKAEKKAEAAKIKSDERAVAMKKKNEAKAERQSKRDQEARERMKPVHGVIFHIATMLGRKEGASKTEIVEHLTKQFPSRIPDEMRTTVGIQLTRLPKTHGLEMKKHNDEKEGGRGLVYKMPAAIITAVESRSVRGGKPRAKKEIAPAAEAATEAATEVTAPVSEDETVSEVSGA